MLYGTSYSIPYGTPCCTPYGIPYFVPHGTLHGVPCCTQYDTPYGTTWYGMRSADAVVEVAGFEKGAVVVGLRGKGVERGCAS